ncbi:uncharacterized protein TRIREDRAFT_42068, partial [Trichoderma reesei QM6a]
TGGSAAAGHDSGLEQPSGAVQMKNIPQTSEVNEKSSDEATDDAAKNAPVDAAASAGPASTDHSEAPAAPSSKGKEDEKSKEEKQEDSAMAIGPADEDIKPAGSGTDSGPVCNITLLLASGSRHPYKIDAKYLSKRHVAMPDEDENGKPDPFSISIYTLKELILREWRSDWEAKPASPTSIRLIHFGKLLDDKEQLKKYQFSHDSPNVVHMSIRPQDLDEEEPKTGSKSLPAGAADGDRVREGRCCVIL